MCRTLAAALLITLCACKSVDPKIQEMALEVEKADLFPVWLFDRQAKIRWATSGTSLGQARGCFVPSPRNLPASGKFAPSP